MQSVAVSGTISGLLGQSLFLTLFASSVVEDLAIGREETTFSFSAKVVVGTHYEVFVSDPPINPSQDCEVMLGEGSVPETGVTDVSIVCTTRTTKLSGSIIGLNSAGLVLRNTSGGTTSDITIAANATRFSFNEYEDQTPFAVGIVTQPAGLFCEVTNATGAIKVGA